MKEVMLNLLAAKIRGAPKTDVHFMHNSLYAVFVRFLGVFSDINQLTFRHLMAWMAYEVWYRQDTHDMVHQPSRYLNVSFDKMTEIAAADANNSKEEWLNTYSPDGMSKMTQQEEQEALAAEHDSSSDGGDEEEDMEELCAYCTGDGGGSCFCGNEERQAAQARGEEEEDMEDQLRAYFTDDGGDSCRIWRNEEREAIHAHVNAVGGMSLHQHQALELLDEADDEEVDMEGETEPFNG